MDTKKQYNIVWADDEIDTLVANSMRILDRENFHLVDFCTNAKDLERILNEKISLIDAVIVDANFNKSDVKTKSERDISGLGYVLTLIKKYNDDNKYLPFYMYTQRADIRQQAEEKDHDIDYFTENDAIFFKDGGIKPLLLRIAEDVSNKNTTLFKIRNSYAHEIEQAKKFDMMLKVTQAERFLMENLVKSFDNEIKNSEDFLNSARKIVERILDRCVERNLIPEAIENFNSRCRFLNHLPTNGETKETKNKEYTLDDKNIFPPTLSTALIYFRDITQDGSHGGEKLRLKVNDYIGETGRANIFKSIVFITIEMIDWFIDFYNNHDDTEIIALSWSVGEKQMNK